MEFAVTDFCHDRVCTAIKVWWFPDKPLSSSHVLSFRVLGFTGQSLVEAGGGTHEPRGGGMNMRPRRGVCLGPPFGLVIDLPVPGANEGGDSALPAFI